MTNEPGPVIIILKPVFRNSRNKKTGWLFGLCLSETQVSTKQSADIFRNFDMENTKAQVWVVKRKKQKGYSYSIQWIDVITGKRRTESCGNDKSYARQLASERRQAIMTGVYREIKPIAYSEFVTEHLAQIKGQLSKATYAEHRLALGVFGRICSPKNLTVIDFAMLEDFRKALIEDGKSDATVNKTLRTLQSILSRAVQRGYIKKNPFEGNRKALWIREPEKTVNTASQQDFELLLEHCPDDKWRAVCIIAYYAGLRREEILHLEWTDIDYDSQVLYVRNKDGHSTKSRKIRTIPMAPQIASALRKIPRLNIQTDYIFRTRNETRLIYNFTRTFHGILSRASLVTEQGKAKFTFHDLRRTCATNLLKSGTPPKVVQRILGHSSLLTTMIYYAAVGDEDMRLAIDRLSRASV